MYAHALIQMWRSVGSLWELVLSFYYVGSRDQIQVSLGLVACFLTKPFHLPNSNLRDLGGYLSGTLIRIERGGVVAWIKNFSTTFQGLLQNILYQTEKQTRNSRCEILNHNVQSERPSGLSANNWISSKCNRILFWDCV